MTLNTPDLPDDERPLLPVADCTCSSCRQLRAEVAAAALLNLIETTKRTFAPDTHQPKPDAPQASWCI